MSEFTSDFTPEFTSDLTLSSPASTHALATVATVAADSETDSREQFLRLHLTADFPALLPVQQVKEVLTIPRDQIVPIPEMPAWVIGIYNWRGEILWMVDVGHLCGLTPWYQQPAYVSMHSTVVLRVKETPKPTPGKMLEKMLSGEPSEEMPAVMQTLGLVVNAVEDMEVCDLSLIQSLPLSSLPPQLSTFLRGYWWKSDDDMLAVLEGEAIMAAMPKS
jgi:positive phototaxis protein PixI